ncbi:unnamed protein product, partial [Brassica rapa subsp. trilocularis]
STGGHGERLRSWQRRNIGHDVEAPTGLETPQKISHVEKKGDCSGGARCSCNLQCIINIA